MSKILKILGKKLKKADQDQLDLPRVIVRKKSDFNEKTFKTVQISEKVSAVIGVVKAKTIKLDVHCFYFDAEELDSKEAQEWVANNYKVEKVFS